MFLVDLKTREKKTDQQMMSLVSAPPRDCEIEAF